MEQSLDVPEPVIGYIDKSVTIDFNENNKIEIDYYTLLWIKNALQKKYTNISISYIAKFQMLILFSYLVNPERYNAESFKFVIDMVIDSEVPTSIKLKLKHIKNDIDKKNLTLRDTVNLFQSACFSLGDDRTDKIYYFLSKSLSNNRYIEKELFPILFQQIDENLFKLYERMKSFNEPTTMKIAYNRFKRIFGLSDNEILICQFARLITNYGSFAHIFFNEVSSWNTLDMLYADIISTVLDIERKEYIKCIEKLMNIGLFIQSDFTINHHFHNMWNVSLEEDELEEIFYSIPNFEKISLKNYYIDESIYKHIAKLLNSDLFPVNILIYGYPGTGKTTFAYNIINELNLSPVVVHDGNVLGNDSTIESIRRSSLYSSFKMAESNSNFIVVVDEADNLINTIQNKENNSAKEKSWINGLLDDNNTKSIWICNNIMNIDRAVLRRFTFSVHFDLLNKSNRFKLWDTLLKDTNNEGKLSKSQIDVLSKEQISPAIMKKALIQASKFEENNSNFFNTLKIIIQAHIDLENGGSIRMENDGNKFDSSFVLDAVNMDRPISDVIKIFKNIAKVYDKKRELPKASGNMLFYGPPGVGKSEFAKYIAYLLKKEYILVKASDLLDMYVGQTEKLIAQYFEKIKNDQKILIIDEIDSFLQSRERSTHSWEITQVNEFLTQLQENTGVCICTTNFNNNLDKAVNRRFTFKFKFEYSNPEQSVLLYNKLLSPLFGKLIPETMAELQSMTTLTPGDFYAVKAANLFIKKNSKSSNIAIEALKKECEFKDTGEKIIKGFC